VALSPRFICVLTWAKNGFCKATYLESGGQWGCGKFFDETPAKQILARFHAVHPLMAIDDNKRTFMFSFDVRWCYRRVGYVTSYQKRSPARIWLKVVRCSGYESDVKQCRQWCNTGRNITQCSLVYSGSCINNRVISVSCETSMPYVTVAY